MFTRLVEIVWLLYEWTFSDRK